MRKKKEKKEEQHINQWAIGAVIVVLAIIIGGSLWILGNSPLAEEETASALLEPVEEEILVNQTEQIDVEFEPPTESNISTGSLGYMSIGEIAEAWNIRPDYYLYRFIDDYQLEGNYSIDSKLWELQAEGGFTTQRARDLATEIESTKQENINWVWPEPAPEQDEDGEI